MPLQSSVKSKPLCEQQVSPSPEKRCGGLYLRGTVAPCSAWQSSAHPESVFSLLHGRRQEVWRCPLAGRYARVPMSLRSRVVSCPPSWLAQEMHLAPRFPRSAGRPTSGQCAAHAVLLQLPFPRRTALPFVTGERRGDEKTGGDVPGLEGAQCRG